MTESTIEPEGLTPAEAAAYAGVSRHVIDAMIVSGCIPVIRVGRNAGRAIILKTTLRQFLVDAQGLTISDDPIQMRSVAETVSCRRNHTTRK